MERQVWNLGVDNLEMYKEIKTAHHKEKMKRKGVWSPLSSCGSSKVPGLEPGNGTPGLEHGSGKPRNIQGNENHTSQRENEEKEM